MGSGLISDQFDVAMRRTLARAEIAQEIERSRAASEETWLDRLVTPEEFDVEWERATEITPRWSLNPLHPHPQQDAFWCSKARFIALVAGRRSGKTERVKRRMAMEAVKDARTNPSPGFVRWYVLTAPTRDQAKRIYWDDEKRLVPKRYQVADPMETELTIFLPNDVRIAVVGMDKPQRFDGVPVKCVAMDEMDDMPEGAYEKHVRQWVATGGHEGRIWFLGRPIGRRKLYSFYTDTIAGRKKGWEAYHWTSEGVVSAEELEQARHDLDPITYAQEYLASFETVQGRAYYSFERQYNAFARLPYDKNADLFFALDFNVDPGVAAICQEIDADRIGLRRRRPWVAERVLGVIGAVWIEQSSNTPRVCRRFIQLFGEHKGRVICYGDATGGRRTTASETGFGDWYYVREILGRHFGSRLSLNVGASNPAEKDRVVAVNSRLRAADGTVRMLVDPENAVPMIEDFDGVMTIPGTDGELNKDMDDKRTHISDAVGYLVVKRYGIPGLGGLTSEEL